MNTTCAIGLDVGGTKIAGGVVLFPSGQMVARQTRPTAPRRGGSAILSEAVDLARALVAEARQADLMPMGVGIGVCELVNLEGQITSGHTVPWEGVSAATAFSGLAPALFESDVRAHALAEARFGAGRKYRQFVLVTIGTGISCCLVQDGVPYAGARGNALILASSPLTTLCPACGTQLQPILEDFASGPAIVARYNAQAKQRFTRVEEVLAALRQGDEVALQVIRSAGEAAGVSIGWLVNVLDPEAVVIGGGLGSAPGEYWDSAVRSIRAHIWSPQSRTLPIMPAALGSDAGVVGAAASLARQLGRLD